MRNLLPERKALSLCIKRQPDAWFREKFPDNKRVYSAYDEAKQVLVINEDLFEILEPHEKERLYFPKVPLITTRAALNPF